MGEENNELQMRLEEEMKWANDVRKQNEAEQLMKDKDSKQKEETKQQMEREQKRKEEEANITNLELEILAKINKEKNSMRKTEEPQTHVDTSDPSSGESEEIKELQRKQDMIIEKQNDVKTIRNIDEYKKEQKKTIKIEEKRKERQYELMQEIEAMEEIDWDKVKSNPTNKQNNEDDVIRKKLEEEKEQERQL